MRSRLSPRPAVAALILVVAVSAALLPARRAAAAPPESFTFTGSGWGHGVGLSQWGAYGQALLGRDARSILTHYYSGSSVRAVDDSGPIRVNVLNGADRASLRGESVGEGGGGVRVSSGTTELAAARDQVVSLSVARDNVVATRGGQTAVGPTLRIEWSAAPTVLNVAGPGEELDGPGHRYRHGFAEATVIGGRLAVVVVVSLHGEYLWGLEEVPSSWPAAALEAQVVAARSYAIRKVRDGERASCRCHVLDTVADQVYAGYSKESGPGGDRWVAAVAATSPSPSTGLVVTVGGDPVVAYYFSSSAGRTESNVDGFGSSSQVSYLRSVDDRWAPSTDNPLASWRFVRSHDLVLEAFNRDLPVDRRLRDVERIELGDRTAGGSVRTAVAVASDGARASLGGATFRSRLDLPSRWLGTAVVRASGADRWSSSVALGRVAAPRSEGSVVVASGDPGHLVDGLVAAPLAKVRNAPLLLAARDGVPPPVLDDVRRRRPTTAYLVGGEGALGPRVEADLREAGVLDVRRLSGPTRYDTGLAVAREMGPPRTLAVVASGDPGHLVDALGAGGPAAATGRPILLVSRDSVPLATRQALTEMGVTSTVVVGGPASVSDATMAQLPNPRRVSGPDRYATAVAVADDFAARVPADRVVVASGDDARLVDALPAGAVAALTVLTPSGGLAGPSRAFLARVPVDLVHVAGGPAAVSDTAYDQIRATVYP